MPSAPALIQVANASSLDGAHHPYPDLGVVHPLSAWNSRGAERTRQASAPLRLAVEQRYSSANMQTVESQPTKTATVTSVSKFFMRCLLPLGGHPSTGDAAAL